MVAGGDIQYIYLRMGRNNRLWLTNPPIAYADWEAREAACADQHGGQQRGTPARIELARIYPHQPCAPLVFLSQLRRLTGGHGRPERSFKVEYRIGFTMASINGLPPRLH